MQDGGAPILHRTSGRSSLDVSLYFLLCFLMYTFTSTEYLASAHIDVDSASYGVFSEGNVLFKSELESGLGFSAKWILLRWHKRCSNIPLVSSLSVFEVEGLAADCVNILLSHHCSEKKLQRILLQNVFCVPQ